MDGRTFPQAWDGPEQPHSYLWPVDAPAYQSLHARSMISTARSRCIGARMGRAVAWHHGRVWEPSSWPRA